MRAWLERSFRNRIFLTVLLVALVPLLLCDVLMTQVMISRSKHTLRTDAQEEMALLTAQLDALLTDCGDVTRALAGSTVTRSALRRGGSDSRTLYQLLNRSTVALREYADFEVYGEDGDCLYTTANVWPSAQSTGWGILSAARAADGIVLRAGNSGLAGACPVTARGGAVLGYAVFRMDDANFDAFFAPLLRGADDLLLVDATWRLLYASQPLRADDTLALLRAQLLSGPVTAATLDKWLLGLFSGVSPLLCREVCFRALGDASPRLERLDDAQRARLEHELDALVFSVETNNLAPTMLLDGDRPKDFSAVPILQYQDALECRGCGSFSELLDEFYLRRDKAEAMRRRSQELTHQVRTLRDRTAKKLAIQQSDLLRCADREALRQKADLIKANLYRIQKGDRTVTVQDYYAEGCPDVTIELDPRKSPQENAAALYKSYRKAKTAEQHLTGLIAEASRNLDYLNSVLDELARAESERDLADIRAELRATGYLRQPRNAKKEKTAQRAPLAFVSSTGYEILVGRSNTQNDELTHRTARRTDIWLHVQKVHGSHVIIRAHDTTPDDQTIAEAASLAVYYSQARGGGKTPVDYTMARFVRKPSGALPGMVLYTDYQTCMAESNEALVERLRVR